MWFYILIGGTLKLQISCIHDIHCKIGFTAGSFFQTKEWLFHYHDEYMMHSGACLFYFLDSTLKYDFFGGLFTEGKWKWQGNQVLN